VDGDLVLAVDVHHGRAAQPRDDVVDGVQPLLGDVHHQVAPVLRGDDRRQGRLDLLDLRVVEHVRPADEVDGTLQHLGDDLQAVDLEGRPRRGDVDDGVGHLDVRRQLGRAGHLDDVDLDAAVREELVCQVRELRGDGRALEFLDGLDAVGRRRGHHQPAAAVVEVQQLLDVRVAGLPDLVEARDAEVRRAVGDVLGDVRGTREQDAQLRVDRVGVQLPVGAVDDVDACPLEQVHRRVVQAPLVGDRDSHCRPVRSPGGSVLPLRAAVGRRRHGAARSDRCPTHLPPRAGRHRDTTNWPGSACPSRDADDVGARDVEARYVRSPEGCRWELVSERGRVATGGRMYDDEDAAREAVDEVRRTAAVADVRRVDETVVVVHHYEVEEPSRLPFVGPNVRPQTRVRLVEADGSVPSDSGENYESRGDAEAAMALMQTKSEDADVFEVEEPSFELFDDGDGWTWRLLDGTGETVLEGQGHEDGEDDVRELVAAIRRWAQSTGEEPGR
jgi:uncharacterized protein YegP (UPF0339 family)